MTATTAPTPQPLVTIWRAGYRPPPCSVCGLPVPVLSPIVPGAVYAHFDC